MKQNIETRIAIPTFTDARGKLSVVDFQKNIPFPVKRVFYVYDVPHGVSRGNHATHSPEFLICARGSCKLKLNDGKTESELLFSATTEGIYIPPLTWRSFSCFSEDCLLICFSDRPYQKDDIVQDFDLFLKTAAQHTPGAKNEP